MTFIYYNYLEYLESFYANLLHLNNYNELFIYDRNYVVMITFMIYSKIGIVFSFLNKKSDKTTIKPTTSWKDCIEFWKRKYKNNQTNKQTPDETIT